VTVVKVLKVMEPPLLPLIGIGAFIVNGASFAGSRQLYDPTSRTVETDTGWRGRVSNGMVGEGATRETGDLTRVVVREHEAV
jgi:hypothetical protein